MILLLHAATALAADGGALLDAARGAVASGSGALARQHAARALWQSNPPPDLVRALRLVVIDSYVVDRRGDDAFRSMLRYQQDHHPLDRATATRFVEALLDLGMEKDAVNWLALLDEAGPAKLLLRLRAGLLSPDATIAHARALLPKSADAGFWRVIADAAQRNKDAAVEAEAVEQLLNAAAQPAPALAPRLWELYLSAARAAANDLRLLAGDDANWSDAAARRAATRPALSRAFYAYLARHAQGLESRHTAQLQLFHALHEARLARAALRLAESGGIPPAAMDPQARYFVGLSAMAIDDAIGAWRYWADLAAPPGIDEAAWNARVAAVAMEAATRFARAGRRENARETYEWVVKRARDGAQIDAARRELARL